MDDLFSQALFFSHHITSYLTPLSAPFQSIISPIQRYLASEPDLKNIALLLLIVWLSLRILGMASRWVYGLVMMMIRLVMFSAVVVGGVWVWQRGLGAAADDAKLLWEVVGGGLVQGRLEEVREAVEAAAKEGRRGRTGGY